MFDVLCISDCCCDLIFKGLTRVPAPGTEEYCQQLYQQAGGGANTPMGLAKLGSKTAYLTAVGDDLMGDLVRNEMKEAGVALDYIQKHRGSSTWVSAVLSTPQDRAFASYAGTGVACTRKQLEEMLGQTRWVHTYTHYCRQFPYLPKECRKAGVPLSLDSTFGEDRTLEEAKELLEQAVLFTPNDQEACTMTGETEPAEALKRLARVCPNVVITLGKKGCIAVLDGHSYEVLPPQVGMADANGAGDLFASGLIAARLSGAKAPDQLRLAAASGALAVTYPGGMSSLYTRKKVEELAKGVTVNQR